MTSPRDLRDRLCELEPQTPDFGGKYEQALQDAFQRKLSPPMKWFVGGIGVMSAGIAVYLATVALVHPELPELARLGLVGGVIFALAWTALAFWTLRRGSWQLKIMPATMSALGWVSAVFLETLFLMLAPTASNQYLATLAVLCGLAILIGAGVQFLGTCIQQSELRTREALLRMEYRLAEIAEGTAGNRTN